MQVIQQRDMKDWLANFSNRLSKTMMEIYAPSVSRQVTHISDHRAAFLRNKIESWDFCPFDVDHDDLIHCSYLIFERVLNLPEMAHVSISKGKLGNQIYTHDSHDPFDRSIV